MIGGAIEFQDAACAPDRYAPFVTDRRRQLAQAAAQGVVSPLTRSIAHGLAIGLYRAAGPALATSRRRLRDGRQPCAWRWASKFFYIEVFQRCIVEHRISQEALQLGVLVLKLLEPLGFGDVHAPNLAFQP